MRTGTGIISRTELKRQKEVRQTIADAARRIMGNVADSLIAMSITIEDHEAAGVRGALIEEMKRYVRERMALSGEQRITWSDVDCRIVADRVVAWHLLHRKPSN